MDVEGRFLGVDVCGRKNLLRRDNSFPLEVSAFTMRKVNNSKALSLFLFLSCSFITVSRFLT